MPKETNNMPIIIAQKMKFSINNFSEMWPNQ